MIFKGPWKGFKLAGNNIAMSFSMWVGLGVILIVIQIFIFLVMVSFANDRLELKHTAQYYWATSWATKYPRKDVVVTSTDGTNYHIEAGQISDIPALISIKERTIRRIKIEFFISLIAYPVFGWMMMILFTRYGNSIFGDRFIRGERKVSEKELAGMLQNEHPCRLKVSKHVRIPIEMETQHIFAVGQSRSGKTVDITTMVHQIKTDQLGRLIIYDVKGDFSQRFNKDGSCLVFDPFSSECVPWSIFRDIRALPDVVMLASSLIPDSPHSGGADRFFTTAARDLFAAYLAYFVQKDVQHQTNAELWKALLKKDADKLEEVLTATEYGEVARHHISGGDKSGQTAGVFATLMTYVSALQYITGLNSSLFSLRDWVNGTGYGSEKQVLIIRNIPRQAAALCPLLSMVIDLMAKEILSLPDDFNRRIYVILDEIGSLNALPAVVSLLTMGGSKGASLVFGTQDFGSLDEKYGEPVRKTLFNNCRTKLILQMSDEDISEYLSKTIGSQEVIEVSESFSAGTSQLHMRDGFNISEQKTNRRVVIPEEIRNLKKLTGFLKVGHFPVAPVEIPLLKDG